MDEKRFLDRLRSSGVYAASVCCALLMLCGVPLVFHDAFFDINRIKVYAVYAIAPFSVVVMILGAMIHPNYRKAFRPDHSLRAPMAAMGAFVLACLLSYYANGFKNASLLGNQGRYCGLLFFLCCSIVFVIIALGAMSARRLIAAIQVTAAAIALLGVLNAIGIDPLGFYARIRAGQEKMFMSTIGHFDFFGTYLVLMLPLAGGVFVFSRSRADVLVSGLCAGLIALGAAASRTDSALAGVHLGCLALLALSGGSLRCMSRACVIWALSFLSMPVMDALFKIGTLKIAFSGPHALLCDHYIALAAGIVLFVCAGVLRALSKKHVRAPGQKKSVVIMAVMVASGLLLLLAAIAYFTLINPQAEIGKAADFLRFNDEWGSCRGFVYKRSLEEYGKYPIIQKIFGKGLDTTRLILEAYFDHPIVERVGIFDDAHNQLIQLLITGGALCAASFAGLYIVMLLTLLRNAGRDPIVCGAAASVFAYSIVMMINVTQPILIATYFSVCALGLSRISHQAERRRNAK